MDGRTPDRQKMDYFFLVYDSRGPPASEICGLSLLIWGWLEISLDG
jgi:hypothetical protein